MSVVSRETMDHARRVADWFGADWDENRHIFRAAADASADAFATVMRAMAVAIEQDVRFGTTLRIREKIRSERQKTVDMRANNGR